MEQSELYGEDPQEVTSVAVRLYSKDQAGGDVEKYQELKAKFNLLAATGLLIPPEYLERAAAMIKANREEIISKQKRQRGILVVVCGLVLVVAGLAVYMYTKHPSAFMPKAH